MNKQVLVIEDDRDISKLIRLHLTDEGFDVVAAYRGSIGLEQALISDYAAIILDVMLPDLNGIEVCRSIRAKKNVPIMMLTSKSEEIDKVLALELGADDYVTKPFSVRELVARVKALVRRSSEPTSISNADTVLSFFELTIELSKRRVLLRGGQVSLTVKEFDLLAFLASSPGRPYSREELLGYIWDYDAAGYAQTVTSHINRLRAKIETNPSHPRYILTEWGIGYRFADTNELGA